jgi:hypothetical protein
MQIGPGDRVVGGFALAEALFLTVLALATLGFVASGTKEGEKRAAIVGGVTPAIMLGAEIGLVALTAAALF